MKGENEGALKPLTGAQRLMPMPTMRSSSHISAARNVEKTPVAWGGLGRVGSFGVTGLPFNVAIAWFQTAPKATLATINHGKVDGA
jgi:hypothetical protein